MHLMCVQLQLSGMSYLKTCYLQFSSINIVDNKIYTTVNEYKTISFEFQNVLQNRLIFYRKYFSMFFLLC